MTIQIANDPQSYGCFQLSPELVQALAPLASPVSATKGETLFQQGAPCRGVYIVQSGLVCISIMTQTGQQTFRRILGPSCIVGLPAALCAQPYSFTTSCAEDCAFGFIEAGALQEFLRTQPILCMEVVRIMSRELAEMNERRGDFNSCRECGCAFSDICAHEMENR